MTKAELIWTLPELLVSQHVAKVIIRRDRIEVEIRSDADREEPALASKLAIPFAALGSTQKGITRLPALDGYIDAVAREKLISAIGQASGWVEAVKSGGAESFKQIATHEGVGERHVRRLSVLAFLSPTILYQVENCTAPSDLTVSVLTEALPHCWAKQEALLR